MLFLTPLPGTRLWDQMKVDGRIALSSFPEDWKYYTLTYPAARYTNLSLDTAIEEMISCNQHFYSMPRILRRLGSNLWNNPAPLISLVGSLSYRSNIQVDCKAHADFICQRGNCFIRDDGSKKNRRQGDVGKSFTIGPAGVPDQ